MKTREKRFVSYRIMLPVFGSLGGAVHLPAEYTVKSVRYGSVEFCESKREINDQSYAESLEEMLNVRK
jgi:hypothetical protein